VVSPSENSFTFDKTDLENGIRVFGPLVDGYIHTVFAYQATRALGYAKTTAPWKDRTGNARNGLGADTDWIPMEQHTIVLFHRVTYGIFLEVRWAGKYSVILPTIKKYGPDTMRLLQKMFQKMNTGGIVP